MAQTYDNYTEKVKSFQESLRSLPDHFPITVNSSKTNNFERHQDISIVEAQVDRNDDSSFFEYDPEFDPTGEQKWELIRTKHNIFSDKRLAVYYKDVYEDTNYECKDYFDSELEWTKEEERKIVWKCDWYICF